MLSAFATPQHRRVTLVFVAVFCLAAIATLVMGLDDNPPALVPASVAAIALILAIVHPWRRARQFKHLFYASGLGFGGLVLLHNVLEAGAVATARVGPLHAIVQGLSVAAFLAAVLLCPPAMVVGLAGALLMFFRDRRGGNPGAAA